jgi:predicted DNA-binding protein (MmcQ/YjbR family)
MNKKHWNTVIIDGTVPERRFIEWIDDSYSLVVAGLTKTQRKNLEK